MRSGVVCVLLLLFSSVLYALEDMDKHQLQQRIEPIGKVHVEQSKTTKPTKTPNHRVAAEEKKAPGQEIYEHYCIVCHKDGVAGAPKFRDAADWNSKKAGRTIDQLVVSAINGLNAMPIKGTCAECTDADLKAAIEYMLPKS